MIEIKFLKQLPCRSANKNTSVIVLRGADLYVDKDGNRFAYIALTNNFKSPFFSLYLHIKEYDVTGTLIKEDRYVNASTYGPTGMYVTKEPIQVEKECDAIDVFISLVEYQNYTFYQDRLSKPSNIKPNERFSGVASVAPSVSKAKVEAPQEGTTEEVRVESTPKVEKEYSANSSIKVRKHSPFFVPLLIAIVSIVIMFVGLQQTYNVVLDPNFSKALKDGTESLYSPFLFIKTLLSLFK